MLCLKLWRASLVIQNYIFTSQVRDTLITGHSGEKASFLCCWIEEDNWFDHATEVSLFQEKGCGFGRSRSLPPSSHKSMWKSHVPILVSENINCLMWETSRKTTLFIATVTKYCWFEVPWSVLSKLSLLASYTYSCHAKYWSAQNLLGNQPQQSVAVWNIAARLLTS